VADAYARKYFHELSAKPADRALLDRFAAEVRRRGGVCDMGCGPGHIARYLRDSGVNVFGLDISPRMVERARILNPDISFRVGDMAAVDLPGESVAGIVAFYAIVNTPRDSLPRVFREMKRVLQPRGVLLLSFHVGDEAVRPDELLGHPNSMDFFFFQPHAITKILEKAGFGIGDVVEREPYPPEVEYQSRRAYVFARTADQPGKTNP
jgi:SAM-dependent methyltransferase